MKYSIECEVDSKIKLEKSITIKHENKEYKFIPDEKGMLVSIRITAPVSNPTNFYSVIKDTPDDIAKKQIIINRDIEFSGQIIREFQQLESFLAFRTNLDRIFWNKPKDEIICETEEEKEKTNVFRYSYQKNYPDPIYAVDETFLMELIKYKNNFSALVNPMAFFREGVNDFKEFRYINSFFNLYFVLEGLYGNGKTKNYDIAREFENSDEFKSIINSVIKSIRKEHKHWTKLDEMTKFRSKRIDAEGIIHLLISTRGELHHFTNNPDRKKGGTPFDHEEFESIAFLSLLLAVRAIASQMIGINLEKQDTGKWMVSKRVI